MRFRARIQHRLALALLFTALIPVIVSIWLSQSMVRNATGRFYVPEVGQRLDEALGLYKDLVHAVKTGMRRAADAIATHEPLRQAARRSDAAAVKEELRPFFQRYPDLVSITVRLESGAMTELNRGRPLDSAKEHDLDVFLPLDGPVLPSKESDLTFPQRGPALHAVFAADQARFEGLDAMSALVDTYKMMEKRRKSDERSYLYAFSALLGITILAAIAVGAVVSRTVSVRIRQLAAATAQVGTGDLSARFPVKGTDEVAELGVAFNRMLSELEASRARIEYLQQMSTWQEMARRLAHEIKNPLTPIQLAMQEIHRRCPDADPAFSKLVSTSLEIVEDEVGTLRRLVTEFSTFARLPRASLEVADLAAFLRDEGSRVSLVDGELDLDLTRRLQVDLRVPEAAAMVHIDRQMLHRAIQNILRNAAQAAAAAGRDCRVTVTLARVAERYRLDFDDDGPGIPEELRSQVFEPYFTSKTEGTGLGLAITKKVIVEHGGSIEALASPSGGARIRIELPVGGAGQLSAILANVDKPPASSRRLPIAYLPKGHDS